MKVMLFVKANGNTEAEVMPSLDELTAMCEFNDSLEKAGILLAGEGLKPSRLGKRIKFTAKSATVIDGPFAEPYCWGVCRASRSDWSDPRCGIVARSDAVAGLRYRVVPQRCRDKVLRQRLPVCC